MSKACSLIAPVRRRKRPNEEKRYWNEKRKGLGHPLVTEFSRENFKPLDSSIPQVIMRYGVGVGLLKEKKKSMFAKK